MPEPGQRYRVAEPGWLSGAEFFAALFASVEASGPEHPLAYRGRWYCWNEGCPVRDVEVTVRRYPEDRRPLDEFRCPQCGKGLQFRGYRQTVVLVPDVKGEPDKPKGEPKGEAEG